ncbi:protein serine/threonine phosphatase 2C [Guyanagaster necrorhizus]|uniref:Protein serine/threonine phosphatase 2C n=1 Tax=Guyanagaster necrorhizus TaxID=856835 RepID=A0A9P7VS88_9AGAR|nr:protein serine/threonine phosphatase 2C [Guyanagaster necrorhizus MCA 3950]KAG7446488.1 protein serine/threonine phosphatase 2C [Guyanagaster necrorhizus MCA 3950]
MEDTHAFVVDFDSVRGQGYFGVFDGHGNKNVSEWCGYYFHQMLLGAMHDHPYLAPEKVLHKAFKRVDETLRKYSLQSEKVAESGSTAAVAFLRIENEDGTQVSFASSLASEHASPTLTPSASRQLRVPPYTARRVLYCANAGDARVVLCRNGTAKRLTQDHKVTDPSEESRIRQAGGVIMRGRVFGTLAVSRSLGNHISYNGIRMKQYVISTPYTSRTELTNEDEFCIIACDGLWDVMADQDAVNLVRRIKDAQYASKILVNHALCNQVQPTRDNVTVMVIRFKDFVQK